MIAIKGELATEYLSSDRYTIGTIKDYVIEHIDSALKEIDRLIELEDFGYNCKYIIGNLCGILDDMSKIIAYGAELPVRSKFNFSAIRYDEIPDNSWQHLNEIREYISQEKRLLRRLHELYILRNDNVAHTSRKLSISEISINENKSDVVSFCTLVITKLMQILGDGQ